jgi:uncharacterized UPF0160 family protein
MSFLAVTHDAVFHADDVFAGATLSIAIPDVLITRTRNPALIAAAEIAFDVGGGAYDHHQIGGNGQRANGIPYASFGLIWRTYGFYAVQRVVGDDDIRAFAIAAEVDCTLVQQVDAADNGVMLSTGQAFAGVRSVGMGTLIGWLRPTESELKYTDYDERYEDAVGIAKIILRRCIHHAVATVDAQAELEHAITHRYGGKVVLFQSYVNGWQDAIRERTDALYAVYPSAGSWRVQGVPVAAGANELRKSLPGLWAGLDGDALARVTGVSDATFAHRGRFIAGAESREGALALATLAVEA